MTDSDAVRVTRLENGLRITSEHMPGAASVALGVCVNTGSRHEDERLGGISHFLEHLLFKGTQKRSARQIAEEIESVGGTINAFTGKEETCYHARLLHEHLELGVDVLSDLILNATLRAEDIELEREVIVQEILDIEDTPDELVHDYYLASYWPGHPLARPVTGSVETVRSIGRMDAVDFMRRRYSSERIVVAAAGNVDHDRLVALCQERLAGLDRGDSTESTTDRPDFSPRVFVAPRDLEQVHLVVGTPGVSAVDSRHELAELLILALARGDEFPPLPEDS